MTKQAGEDSRSGDDAVFDNAPTIERRTMSAEEAAALVGEADRRSSGRMAVAKRAPAVVRTNEAQPIPLVRPAEVVDDLATTDEILSASAATAARHSHAPRVLARATERHSSALPLVSVDATQEIALDDVLEARDAPVVDDDVDAFVVAPARVSRRAFDTQELRKLDRDHLSMLTTGEIVLRKKRASLLVGLVVGVSLAILGMVAVAAMLALDDSGGHRVTGGEAHRLVASTLSLERTPRAVRAMSVGPQRGSVSIDALPRAGAH